MYWKKNLPFTTFRGGGAGPKLWKFTTFFFSNDNLPKGGQVLGKGIHVLGQGVQEPGYGMLPSTVIGLSCSKGWLW